MSEQTTRNARLETLWNIDHRTMTQQEVEEYNQLLAEDREQDGQ